jgi:hypothetical protein
MLLGLNGDLPTLKRLAAAGRLLVVDFGQLSYEANKEEIYAWLHDHAFRTERDYRDHGEDLYFIDPPEGSSRDYKISSAEAYRELIAGSEIMRRITYPFNQRNEA